MIFSSWQYLLFLPVAVMLYWRLQGTARLALVVAASYVFYMSWLPAYAVLLALMTTLNWALALTLRKAVESNSLWKKPLFAVGLLMNLGALCYYKYANFFLSNIYASLNFVFEKFGASALVVPQESWPMLNVILPLGISFFVFEFVHYIVDIYRGDKPVKSWLEFTAFAAFFPSQIAGPIKRYQDFLQSLRDPLPLDKPLFHEGMTLIVQGLFKKVAIADPIGALIFPAYMSTATLSFPDAFIAAFGFLIQVYCDFSGYTDMGRGSALLMGIRLPVNFDLPYLSSNLADFWRRWHISLGLWLRDYVYISLGGSRVERLVNWRNLFIVMVTCGLWHGAAWHYVAFGCMQGVGLVIDKEWRALVAQVAPMRALAATWLGTVLGVMITISFVMLTYVVFRAPDLPQAMAVLTGLLNFADLQSTLWLPLVKASIIPVSCVYLAFWLGTEFLKHQRNLPCFSNAKTLIYPSAIRYASWTAAVLLALGARPTEAVPFVYFQF